MFQTAPPSAPLLGARSASLQPSQIRAVSDLGMGMEDVIALWFGEGTWPSSQIAVAAAKAALDEGDHFYQPNPGQPPLREALATYMNRVFETDIKPNRIMMTASGMQGVVLTAQAITSPGDRVILVDPSWPNIAEAFALAGGHVSRFSVEARDGRWQLDLDGLLALLTPDVRAVLINSPHNPTGWVMTRDEQQAVLDHCRARGIWIIADDVYSRLVRAGDHAPSFLQIAEPEDRLISVNSFSKTWSMTGWRAGWLVVPPALEETIAMLNEFNLSGPSGFIQKGCLAVVREGEAEVALLKSRLEEGYEVVAEGLKTIPGVDFIRPDGAFYCFFRVEGLTDSLSLAKRILTETKVGLAPGIAFSPKCDGFLRLCYAQPKSVLVEAFERLGRFDWTLV